MPCERDTLIRGERAHGRSGCQRIIARLMTIRDLVSAGQQAPAGPALPDNTLRNNDTGATYCSSRKRPAHRIRQTMPIQSRLPGLAAGIASKAILWQRSSTVSAWILASMVQQARSRRKTSADGCSARTSSLARSTSRRSSERHKWASVRHCRRGMRGLKISTRAVQIQDEDVVRLTKDQSKRRVWLRAEEPTRSSTALAEMADTARNDQK